VWVFRCVYVCVSLFAVYMCMLVCLLQGINFVQSLSLCSTNLISAF